jgi:hypothetical protein
MRKNHRRAVGDRGIGTCQTRDNQFSVACRSVAVHRAERAPQRRGYSILSDVLQKFLARDAPRPQARSAMSMFARSRDHGRAFLAILVSAAFLWALALSASPQLHQRVHKDASRVEHNCAATVIASGSYDHAVYVPLVSAPAPAVHFSKILALTPQWVESPFLGARIFEHAPPARA